jgi:hypothetical protein
MQSWRLPHDQLFLIWKARRYCVERLCKQVAINDEDNRDNRPSQHKESTNTLDLLPPFFHSKVLYDVGLKVWVVRLDSQYGRFDGWLGSMVSIATTRIPLFPNYNSLSSQERTPAYGVVSSYEHSKLIPGALSRTKCSVSTLALSTLIRYGMCCLCEHSPWVPPFSLEDLVPNSWFTRVLSFFGHSGILN